MKIKQAFIGIICLNLLFLCSRVSVGDKFQTPSLEKLELGKLAPADAFALFGKPKLTASEIKPTGNFEFYHYRFSRADISAVSTRETVLEFKDGKLNGYFYWSSFHDGKTKVDVDNINKLKAGFGTMDKDDVLVLMGEPDGKAMCPTEITNFKDHCDKNTEVWGWFTANNISLWGATKTRNGRSRSFI